MQSSAARAPSYMTGAEQREKPDTSYTPIIPVNEVTPVSLGERSHTDFSR